MTASVIPIRPDVVPVISQTPLEVAIHGSIAALALRDACNRGGDFASMFRADLIHAAVTNDIKMAQSALKEWLLELNR
jgi:hypothetical protein